ncbi:hypothetical protein ROZALSC1DRAFT_25377 [Rozella allomycis CSF55]|uniref:Uncharacterized protein n=1 Tax=Rozella allomycis (strain CSF55) TaxID=988480 RepID=A0A4P9YBY0_ROZAC|nr:hypothetical protein ROZALSC1DRAFT_25377 [Rozella allomycis CSF55]
MPILQPPNISDVEEFNNNGASESEFSAKSTIPNAQLNDIRQNRQMTSNTYCLRLSAALHKECMKAMGYESEEHPQYQNLLKRMKDSQAIDLSVIAARVKRRKVCPTNYARPLGWQKATSESQCRNNAALLYSFNIILAQTCEINKSSIFLKDCLNMIQ